MALVYIETLPQVIFSSPARRGGGGGSARGARRDGGGARPLHRTHAILEPCPRARQATAPNALPARSASLAPSTSPPTGRAGISTPASNRPLYCGLLLPGGAARDRDRRSRSS